MTALPLQGPEKAACPCGCGLFGKPVTKRHGHIRGCSCRPCLNGRNSQGGKRRHRSFAKAAGIATGRFRTSEEEAWRDRYRWEVKSGAQVQPIVTRYQLAKRQSDATVRIGDSRPFAFGVQPNQAADPALVVIEASVHREREELLVSYETLLHEAGVL